MVTLCEAQQTALRRLLCYVAGHSRFYANHLPVSFDPDSFELQHLDSLPFTEQADLRKWRDFLCVSQSDVQRMVSVTTSGTTGPPKRLAFTQNDLHLTCVFFRSGMQQLVKPGERLAVIIPGADRPDGVADLLRQSLPDVEALCPPENTDLPQWLTKGRFHCLVTAPTQLAQLIRALPTAPPPLRAVLNSADFLSPKLKRTVRNLWNCELLDHYGLTETAFACAVECPAHNGYHIRALDILIEIVDINDGTPLPAGEEGEIVLTTLRHEAMPLIRYRTGDVASLMPESDCACGNSMPRLGYIVGRLDKSGRQPRIVHTPKGNVLQGQYSPSIPAACG